MARIQAILNEPDEVAARRPRTSKEFLPWGGLIAAAASSRGKALAEISVELGYARDYLVRICRGDITLIARAARQIGGALGVDLAAFVGMNRVKWLDGVVRRSAVPAVAMPQSQSAAPEPLPAPAEQQGLRFDQAAADAAMEAGRAIA
jgi:hypothetical protein